MSPHENQALKTRTQKSNMMADAHSLGTPVTSP